MHWRPSPRPKPGPKAWRPSPRPKPGPKGA